MTRTTHARIAEALTESRGAFGIESILTNAQLQFVTEDDLQAAIAIELAKHGVTATREVRLSDGASRIDLVAGAIGIEVKIDSSWADVVRQLTRYAHCREIVALVLVTTRVKHHTIPTILNGKIVRLVSLIGSAL